MSGEKVGSCSLCLINWDTPQMGLSAANTAFLLINYTLL